MPDNSVANTSGKVAAPATMDAPVALPVRCSTSQGNATRAMPLAPAARNAENRISTTGTREVLIFGSIEP